MPVKKESRIKNQESSKKTVAKKVTRRVIPSEQSSRLRTKTRNLKIKKAKLGDSSPAVQNDKRRGLLSVPVYSLAGRSAGTMSLPKEVFGAKVNEKLLAQAVRVYSTNQAKLPGSTKKRGEVHGTTAKMYKQKGTGRARHGAKTAPIFVGGGVAFGPKPRLGQLSLPKKMKQAALVSALSDKALEKQIVGVTGLEKATGKTKEVAKLVNSLSSNNVLIITGERLENLVRAAGNIPGINVLPVTALNTYEVVRHQVLAIDKSAIEKMNERIRK